MTLNDDFDVPALHQSYLQVKDLEKAAINRARDYLEAAGKPCANFHNTNGFTVRAHLESLLDSNFVDVTFYQRDAQGNGPTNTITVPRSIIIFSEPTAEEKDFAEYKRLKAIFEK